MSPALGGSPQLLPEPEPEIAVGVRRDGIGYRLSNGCKLQGSSVRRLDARPWFIKT